MFKMLNKVSEFIVNVLEKIFLVIGIGMMTVIVSTLIFIVVLFISNIYSKVNFITSNFERGVLLDEELLSFLNEEKEPILKFKKMKNFSIVYDVNQQDILEIKQWILSMEKEDIQSSAECIKPAVDSQWKFPRITKYSVEILRWFNSISFSDKDSYLILDSNKYQFDVVKACATREVSSINFNQQELTKRIKDDGAIKPFHSVRYSLDERHKKLFVTWYAYETSSKFQINLSH